MGSIKMKIFVALLTTMLLQSSMVAASNFALPLVPAGVTATATESSIRVSWESVDDASSYDVRINGAVNTTSKTSYTFSGLQPGTVYGYSVRAKNDMGASPYSVTQSIATKTSLVSLVPPSVSAYSDSSSVTLFWTDVTGATGYDVIFGDQMVSVSGTSYRFGGLPAGSLFSYSVRSSSGENRSSYSSLGYIWTAEEVTVEETTTIPATQASSATTIAPNTTTAPPTTTTVPTTSLTTPPRTTTSREVPSTSQEVSTERITTTTTSQSQADQSTGQEEEITTTDLPETAPVTTVSKIEVKEPETDADPLNIDLSIGDDYIHQVGQAIRVYWTHGIDDEPEKYVLSLYDNQGMLVDISEKLWEESSIDVLEEEMSLIEGKGKLLKGSVYDVLLPEHLFIKEGLYVLKVDGIASDLEPIKTMEQSFQVIGEQKVYVVTGAATRKNNRVALSGDITTAQIKSLSGYGFYWGDTPNTLEKLYDSSLSSSGQLDASIPVNNDQHKIYYRAYAVTLDGREILGTIREINFDRVQEGIQPEIVDVDYKEVGDDQHTHSFSIITDLAAEALVFEDSNGIISTYKGPFSISNNQKLWEIQRVYRKTGIYNETIQALGAEGVSEQVQNRVIVGRQAAMPLRLKLSKTDYPYVVGSNAWIRLNGKLNVNHEEDMIRKVVYSIAGEAEKSRVLHEAFFDESSVVLNQEALAINPREAVMNDPGLYVVTIYGVSDLYHTCPVPLGEVNIIVKEQVDFSGVDVQVKTNGDHSFLDIKGTVTGVGDNPIDGLYVEDGLGELVRVYRKSWFFGKGAYEIHLDESLPLKETGQALVMYAETSSGSITKHIIGLGIGEKGGSL